MSGIAPEVVDRMVALVRDLRADHIKHGAHDYVQDFVARTAEIAALLPEPVDPDLIEARQLAAQQCERAGNPAGAEMIRNGAWDDQIGLVGAALAGIKRGRALAASEKVV